MAFLLSQLHHLFILNLSDFFFVLESFLILKVLHKFFFLLRNQLFVELDVGYQIPNLLQILYLFLLKNVISLMPLILMLPYLILFNLWLEPLTLAPLYRPHLSRHRRSFSEIELEYLLLPEVLLVISKLVLWVAYLTELILDRPVLSGLLDSLVDSKALH